MRRLIVVVMLLTFAGGIAWGDLGESHVALLSPYQVDPNHSYQFRFWVQNASPDGEAILSFWICFPDQYQFYPMSMGYEQIVDGRPDFMCGVHLSCPLWDGLSPSRPQILQYEGTLAWIEVYIPPSMDPGTPVSLDWTIAGTSGARVEGSVSFFVAVQKTTWGSIKGLYR